MNFKIWFPPVNLWSKPFQARFDDAYKKGYNQALEDVKQQIDKLKAGENKTK